MTTQNSSILLKRSGIPGHIPLSANLAYGELALNYADSVLYSKDSSNLVQPLTIPPAEKEIYVELHGNDAWDGLTQSRPKRTLKAALNACEPYGCVKLGAGIFFEDNPMVMPQFSTIYGSGTRGTSIIPLNKTKNILYVTNSCYCTGFAFRDHIDPAIAVSYPDEMERGTAQSGTSNTITLSTESVGGVGLEDYYRTMQITITAGTGVGQVRNVVTHNVTTKVVTVDSNWITIPNSTSEYLVNLAVDYTYQPPTKRYNTYVTHSPYLYNLLSVTTTGTGMVVDGYLSAGLKSFVVAQFTQYNQGGDGFVVKNLGYAQLVSIYGICCNEAFRAENGGTASMGNCNINFGNRGIVAVGVSPPMLTANLAPSFTYNRTKCERDTGLIVDALAQDLLFSGNTQSTFAAIQYWNQSEYVGQVGTQLPLTINTISYVQNLASKVVVNDTTGTRYQATVAQVTGNTSSNVEANTVYADFQVVLDILANGTTAITDAIIPNSITANTSANVANAYLLLQTNKAYIQAEAIAFANAAKPVGWPTGYYFDQTTCARDAALVVDAIAQDFLYDTTSQSTFAGLQYWNQNTYTGNIRTELVYTINAIKYASNLAQKIVTNNTSGPRYQALVTQNTSLPAATSTQASAVATDFEIITDILENGTGGVTDIIVPNSLTANTAKPVQNAYALLQANKSYIAAEAVAYANVVTFDTAKCSRDTGLIIDAVAQDLLFEGSTQSTFAGLQYWSQSGKIIQPYEVANTVLAIDYARTISLEYTSDNPKVNTEFTLIRNILSGVQDPTTVTDIIVPNTLTAATSGSDYNAAVALQANRSTIQALVQTYTAENFVDLTPTQLDKCYRDVGFMVDSVTFDLLYGGNRQAVQSGIYYYGFSSSDKTVNPNEVPQTTAAYDYIKLLIPYITTNTAVPKVWNTLGETQVFSANVATSVESDLARSKVDIITGIINNGPSVAEAPSAISLTRSINIEQVNAANLIGLNRTFIAKEVLAYITQFTFDKAKCARDVGYIIDSISFDLLHGGNRQAVQSGVYYYSFSDTNQAVAASEIPAVNNAYAYIRTLIPYIITNTAVPQVWNTKGLTQQFSSNVSISAYAPLIQSKVNVITTIINTGPSAAAAPSPIPLTANSTLAVANAANLLEVNREFIANEVAEYAKGTYNNNKCKRDLGLIVDALAFDLKFPSANGNSQSNFAGLQYWAQSGLAIPSGELTATLGAMANLKYQMQQVVTTTPEDNYIGSEVDIIINLLNGTTAANSVTNLIVPNATVATSNANALAAYTALQSARSTIQTTVLNYVTTTYPGLLDAGQQTKCSRDVGYIIDSICFDLKYNVDNTYVAPSNRQAIQSGIYYLGFSNTTVIPNEFVMTTAAYNHLKQLIPYIVTDTVVPANNRYQSTYTQNVSLGSATTSESTRIQNNIDTILTIISTGPNASANANATPISLTANSDSRVSNAFALLYANKDFLKEEVIGYINSFFYDPSKCARDVGYMVDSISFDLKYGGNRQAIQSGVYYYGYSSNTTIVGEIPQTTAAYNYLKKVTSMVSQGKKIDLPFQTDVDQIISTSIGTPEEAASVNTNISLITNIINNGPSVAPEPRPISLIRSSDPFVNNAATLLSTNRDFIKKEIVAYADAFFPTQTGYTIAVKDVVANTDPRTALSATTKPYVGLALNITGDTFTADGATSNTYRSVLATRTDYDLGITTVDFQENLVDAFAANTTVTFYQRSALSASGQTFEYVGAGTNVLTALPRFGFGLIKKENQVVTSDGGVVYYTATDQFGNFQIGADLTINFNTGTLSGRTFTRSLFAQITPFILALTND
jgi:hypothetical protein